jgi:hypothetical protein
MKDLTAQLMRICFIVAILAIVVSCFNSSFSKRKYTKGTYKDRIEINSRNHENGDGDRDKHSRAEEDSSEENEESLAQKTVSSSAGKKNSTVHRDYLNSTETHQSLQSIKAKSKEDSFQKVKVIESVKKATENVKSTVGEKKSKKAADFYWSDFGWIMMAVGLLLMLITAIVMLVSGGSGCVLIIISFTLVCLGAVIGLAAGDY